MFFLLWVLRQQTNKFAALTTLLTEEEAYVVRDLTTAGTRASCGRIRHGKEAFRPTVQSHHSPAAHTGFRHWRCRCQRISRRSGGSVTQVAIGHETMSSGGLFSGRLPSSLRTTLEMPSPPLHMAELLRFKRTNSTLRYPTTVSGIGEAPTELATAVYACECSGCMRCSGIVVLANGSS